MSVDETAPGVPWLTDFVAPGFFETALGPAIILGFVVMAAAPVSIYAHRWWLSETTLMLWIVVALAGGPFGALAWFVAGRPAVRRFRDGGNGALGPAT